MTSDRKPLVSVVVCTYNGAAFLSKQLDSLLAQSYAPVEIVVCDDASTDDTVRIAKEYAAKDCRIRLHQNEQNMGYNRNFEKGFLMASGAYIAVCDQDDIWKREKLQKMMRLFDSETTLLVHAQSVRFTKSLPAIEYYTARRYFTGKDVKKLFYFNTIAGHNMLLRKELLQYALPLPQGVFYDWWLALSAAIYGSINGTNEVLTFHRAHTSNVTLGKKDEKKQTREKAEERLHTLTQVLQIQALKEEDRIFAGQLSEMLTTLRQKNFSFPLFFFLLQHAGTLLFFKKGSFLSRMKLAYRLSFALQ
jgi:cellulose synthase/poly-beta-1,6-N-acetylglucosamine synthase-like glycosyltransferase